VRQPQVECELRSHSSLCVVGALSTAKLVVLASIVFEDRMCCLLVLRCVCHVNMPSPLYPALSHLIPPSPPRYLPSSLPRYFPPSLPQAHFHLPIHHNLLEPQFPHPFLPKLSSLPFPAFLPPCPISVFCWGPLVCLQCLVRPLDRPRIAIYSVRAAKVLQIADMLS